MRYQELRALYKNKGSLYNSADGTTTDTTVDAVITRSPNDFLFPKINGFTITNTLHITIGILAVIILAPMAFKTLKNLISNAA